MALQLIHAGGVVALGFDSVTGARGFLTKIINRTGHASVLGEGVSASTATDKEAVIQSNEYDEIGVVAEAGIAEGSEMWVWGSGSICQVLYKDTVAAVKGNILLAGDTNGRHIDSPNPSGGLPAADTHFKECGHVLQDKTGGTNVLALAHLHFN